MTPSTFNPPSTPKCHFLKVPAEIRLIIYEHVAPECPLVLTTRKFRGNNDTLAQLALTQVSRLIRRESVPILCHNLVLDVRSATHNPQYAWFSQILSTADAAFLAKIPKYCIRSPRFSLEINVDLAQLEKLVAELRRLTSTDETERHIIDNYKNAMTADVLRLDVTDDKRRVMTEKVMASLVALVCELSDAVMDRL